MGFTGQKIEAQGPYVLYCNTTGQQSKLLKYNRHLLTIEPGQIDADFFQTRRSTNVWFASPPASRHRDLQGLILVLT